MTGAMNAAISGLKSHMNKMNVIGNNIANVNTMAYKPGRVVFTTAQYTTVRGGSNGGPLTGGRNPAQIGYGNQIGSIDLDMSGGSYTPTGRATDCTIAGDGFFLTGNKEIANVIDAGKPESLKSLTLTRLGRFEFGPDGYLVDLDGNTVYGFLATGPADDKGIPPVSDQLVPIRFPRLETDGATGKQTIKFPVPDDTNGNRLKDDVGDDADNPNPLAQFDGITIDPETGKISGTSKDTEEYVVIGYLAIGNVTNPNGVTQENGSNYKAGDGAGQLTVSMMGGMEDKLGLTHINASVDGAPADIPDGMIIGSAGDTGLVTNGLEMSKTDLAVEIAEMITTQRGYQANSRIITVTDAMLEELVNMKR